MKPFILKEALAGKAVMLRNGKKAFVRYHETELPVDDSERLVGCLESGCWMSWYESGHYHGPDSTTIDDIIGMYSETRVINGFEVLAPETQAPKIGGGDLYYIPCLFRLSMHDGLEWEDDSCDYRMLERGLVFLNPEDAIATAKAMLGIDPNSEDEP